MRNRIAKALRKEAGTQTSTSNRLEYKYAKHERTYKFHQTPKFNISRRQQRLGLLPEVQEKEHKRRVKVFSRLFKNKIR